VGQLTTGVTVPEWTAVMMLSNLKSPSLYMQAAFRAQNSWSYDVDGEKHRKQNAYVFDFAPSAHSLYMTISPTT
jgi:type I site-specific restriction endonuclease